MATDDVFSKDELEQSQRCVYMFADTANSMVAPGIPEPVVGRALTEVLLHSTVQTCGVPATVEWLRNLADSLEAENSQH